MSLKIVSLIVAVGFGTETENADVVRQDRHNTSEKKRTESAIVVAIDETTDFIVEIFEGCQSIF